MSRTMGGGGYRGGNRLAKYIAGLAFLLLALRFFWLNYAPFINDEPKIQLLLDKYLFDGRFPVFGIPGGSQTLRYGPGAQWMYALPRLVSESIYLVFVYHCFLISAASVFLYSAFRRLFTPFVAALLFLLLVSSPYLTFYARQPWNNTFLLFFTAVTVWALTLIVTDERRGRLAYWPWPVLGASAAMALNTHLIAGPMVVALALTLVYWLFWQTRQPKKRAAACLTLAAVTGLAVLSPYFLALYRNVGGSQEIAMNARWGDGKQFWWSFIQTSIHLTFWKMKYFMHYAKDHFFDWCGPVAGTLFRKEALGFALKLVAFVILLRPAYLLLRRRAVDVISLFASLSLIATVFVLYYQNIALHPHYFHSSFWLVYFALGMFYLLVHRPRWQRLMTGLITVVTALNLVFIGYFAAYVYRHEGIRSHYYGSTIGNQIAVTEEICKKMPESGGVVDVTRVDALKYPFDFLVRRLEACQGVPVYFVHDKARLPRDVFGHLEYRQQWSARLFFKRSR